MFLTPLVERAFRPCISEGKKKKKGEIPHFLRYFFLFADTVLREDAYTDRRASRRSPLLFAWLTAAWTAPSKGDRMPKIILSSAALSNNYRLLKSKTDGELIPVLKADAYGHGAAFAFSALEQAGASHFAVACAYEAAEILSFCKDVFTKPRVLLLGAVDKNELLSLCSSSVTLSVHSPAYARLLSEALAGFKRQGLLAEHFSLSVHLKLETGMHRVGLRERTAIRAILLLPHLAVKGAYSHLGCAADKARTKDQLRRFLSLRAALPEDVFTHLSASEGLCRYGDFSLSAVRVGLALYGVLPSGLSLPLKPVMRFFARVLAVFTVKRGDLVGYGSVRADRRRRLAVIDAGYADGIPPQAGKGGFVLLRGKRCPFFGAVCMDRATLDIGELALKEGDEVCLFGSEAGDTARFAEACGISPYALLTARSPRTQRVIL